MPKTPAPHADLRVKDVAEELSCSYRQVWRLIQMGLLTSYRVGRQRRVTRASLVAYKSRHAA